MSNDPSTGGYQPPEDESPLGSLSTDYPSGSGATTGGETTDYGTSGGFDSGATSAFGSDVAGSSGTSGDSTAAAAKDQAAQVGQTAKTAGSQVASTAAEQAKNVAGETKMHARTMLKETQSQVSEQAGTQKDKASTGLRSLSDELRSLADGTHTGGSGMVTDFSRQASDKMSELAGWLESRDPNELLDDVRDIARRKPGTFLLGSLVAGVLAGRLTRGAVDAKRDEKDSDDYTPRTADSTTSAWSDTGTGHAHPEHDVLVVQDEVVVDTDPFGARPQSTTLGGDRL